MSYPAYSGNSQSGQSHSSSHSSHHPAVSASHGYPMHASSASQPAQSTSYYSQQQSYLPSSQSHANVPLSSSSLRPLPFSRGGYPAHVPSNSEQQSASHTIYAPHAAYGGHGQPAAYPGYAAPSQSSPQHYSQAGQTHPHTHTSPIPPTYRPSSTVPHIPHPHSPAGTHSYPSNSLAASTERFPCPHCEKTFSRNFDRKRHMEIHVPGSAGNNRCQFCHKDYSRADSLKRHLDNGCDMKP